MNNHFAITLSLVLAFFLANGHLSAQKINIEKGDFKELKGQSELNVEFLYETSVGDFDKEEDYLNEKVAEKNADEKGSGDEWRKKWVADRKERFEPKFFELFNEYSEKSKLKAVNDPNVDYTLIVKTTHTEPGWNVGVMRKSAHINVELNLVDSANPNKVLAQADIKKVPGRDAWGFDFDTGYRLQEAYALTGKVFVKYLMKKVLK